MKTTLKLMLLFSLFLFLTNCEEDPLMEGVQPDKPQVELRKGKKPGSETAGNNLSYPVIWSEGVAKTLPGTPGMAPVTTGAWWYWWGTNDDDGTPKSCKPDPDDPAYCDDGKVGLVTGNAPGAGWVKAYLQKDPGNTWQAGTANGSGTELYVDEIDWGDNLESVDWYTRSQVRTEVVLNENVTPMLEYEMRHVSGWGSDEVHGLAVSQNDDVLQGPGTMATVYSHCARLTIQRLYVSRDDPRLSELEWVPTKGWAEPADYTGDDLINDEVPLFNKAVYNAGDGPGYYSAEINVKGKVIYGYTWNVRRLNEGPGDYRITFSFDENCGTASLNTFFNAGTSIKEAIEEVIVSSSDGTGGGGTALVDPENNLTYIDIRILERGGGGGRP